MHEENLGEVSRIMKQKETCIFERCLPLSLHFQEAYIVFQKKNLRKKAKLTNNHMLHLMGNYTMLEGFEERKEAE